MDRMKTFLIYALLIIGFFALSIALENGLLYSMYANIPGEFNSYYEQTGTRFSLSNSTATACNVNGYISFNLTNSTGSNIEKCYLKLDLYNKQKLLADTEYFEITNFQNNETKKFNIKFKANNIKNYKMSILGETPDKTNIIDIFGWEVDLTNVLGLGIDLSNISIFGKPISEVFSWNNIKQSGRTFWSWFITLVTGIPWWGYFGGWLFYVGLL